MQLHELSPKNKLQKKKRIGRGGKRGGYSGRGIKGQKSRAGRKLPPIVRELTKRYPKLKGYRFKTKGLELGKLRVDETGKEIKELRATKVVTLNLDVLEKKFSAEDKITPEVLVEKKIINRVGKKIPRVKILAKGEVKKPLNIEGCQFSKPTKIKIEKAGGKIC